MPTGTWAAGREGGREGCACCRTGGCSCAPEAVHVDGEGGRQGGREGGTFTMAKRKLCIYP
eukprot:117945-Chlamydomonas_euryale.AAC.1